MQQTELIKLVGNSSKAKVLTFLIKGRGLDYSMSDIARNSDISWTSLNLIWKDLIKLEIITHTRNIGKAKLYKLNTKNEVVKILIKLYKKLLLQETKVL
jgi:hypothetical protein